jgi:hypothetical protein
VGRTAALREGLALRTMKDHVFFFQALLREEMPVQEAVHLLRVSGTHRLNYLMRCIPPDAVRNLARQFDVTARSLASSQLHGGPRRERDYNQA